MVLRSITARVWGIVLVVLLAALGAPSARAVCEGNGPIISEFMASNSSAVLDEDNDYSDWLEIYNPCLPSVNLDGWYLTDDAANLTKWRFPAVTLTRGHLFVVFASGKNRRTAGSQLHTNFKLDAGGEYLALVEPDGATIAYEFAPTYPPQIPDVSYGVPQSSTTLLSPGASLAWHV